TGLLPAAPGMTINGHKDARQPAAGFSLALLSRLIPAVPDGHEDARRPTAAPPPRAFRLVPAYGGIRPVL
ncbi:MAG: hypothetical protein WCJ35_07730, partial [Planctomycetota bacterium]